MMMPNLSHTQDQPPTREIFYQVLKTNQYNSHSILMLKFIFDHEENKFKFHS